MKIKKTDLEKVIKEEIEKGLEEGWLDAAKSLAGQAGSAISGKAKQIGQAVGGAVTTAKQASVKADVAPMAKKAAMSVDASLNIVDGLVRRMERLGMPEVTQLDAVTDALRAAKVALQKLVPQAPAPKPAPAPAKQKPSPSAGLSRANVHKKVK